MSISNKLIEKILDNIEEKEARLLVWGIVDISFSRNEIYQCIFDITDNINDINEDEKDPDIVFNALIDKQLIFYIDSDRFRSRMCETVRLLYHLRQMFPRNAGNNWQSAPTLVSDFRLIKRNRSFPKRNISQNELIGILDRNNIHQNIIKSISILSKNMKLANFQIRSTEQILNSLSKNIVSGNLISAGTGSGKTLGFYFACLGQISSNIFRNIRNDHWLQCLSIYPRTELLKDQLNSIYAEARKLDEFLKSNGKRKISVGALYFDVPENNYYVQEKWKKIGEDYVCPFLTCIKCSSKLLWKKNNLDQGIEKLSCQNPNCGFETSSDEIMLTRNKMVSTPPDILFTTTEMLNQNTSELKYHKLFGIRRNKLKPQMILLDEIHTYSGTHGAQVAYLIRRLRMLIKSKITFVALSATLVDGARFLSRMVNVSENKVNVIEPFPDEMDYRGSEYLVALKGDPISKSALLSTTIQANMLLARMLDKYSESKSEGFFGKKLFAFTDDIDVVNRLYHSTLDSEGRKYNGYEDGSKDTLASLRDPSNLSGIKNNQGQVWKIPSIIQNDSSLTNKKKVVRVSSQDTGSQSDAEIVIATSKLEVGVDDPDVGAVVQHKSPREFASFLQRKGRAGRSEFMRPWTVVVLSDFGRDKLSYQSYDLLFNPQMKIQPLPLKSQYIQRMQAVYTLLDFLCFKLKNHDPTNAITSIDVWKDLSQPYPQLSNRIKLLRTFLNEILTDSEELENFKIYLQDTLGLKDQEIKCILWEFPRPLMTVVIPTALRRLETNWNLHQNQKESHTQNSPLPEFIPSTLFNDLNLPDVIIDFSLTDQNEKNESMPIFQALKTFAPGRVSRRFGIAGAFQRHWVISQNNNEISSVINLDESYEFYYYDKWDYVEDGLKKQIKVYRPTKIKVKIPAINVVDTSNAILNWITSFSNVGNGKKLNSPQKTKLSNILNDIEIFTHSEQTPATVRRFYLTAEANIRFQNGDDIRTSINHKYNDENVGLGFDVSADAIKFNVNINIDEITHAINMNSSLQRSLRVSKYFDDIKNEKVFYIIKNPFLRNWLGEIYYNMLILESYDSNIDLASSDKNILNQNTKLTFAELLNDFFQSHIVENEDENDENLNVQEHQTEKLRDEIETCLKDKNVLSKLSEIAHSLWDPIDHKWNDWIEEKYFLTIASGVMNAFENFCRDFNVEDLVLDLVPKISELDVKNLTSKRSFFISEKTPGGIGVIDNFVNLYSLDPRKFYSLVENMFNQNDYELTDFQLRKFLKDKEENEDGELSEYVHNFRNINSYEEKLQNSKQIRKFLIDKNFVPYHGFITSLFNRILRPGSNDSTDYFLHKLIIDWEELEENLNIEIDTKLISFIYRNNNDLEAILVDLGFDPPTDRVENWRFNVLQGILWLRGRVVRNKHLDLYNPFAQYREPERLLLSHIFRDMENRINFRNHEEWFDEFKDTIEKDGQVIVSFDEDDKENIQNFLKYLIVNPVDSDYLLVYARVYSIIKIKHRYDVYCEVVENLQ